jgi:hypothetical protein
MTTPNGTTTTPNGTMTTPNGTMTTPNGTTATPYGTATVQHAQTVDSQCFCSKQGLPSMVHSCEACDAETGTTLLHARPHTGNVVNPWAQAKSEVLFISPPT